MVTPACPQPQPCHARRNATACEHGRSTACFTRHARDDARLGQPLCPDCYDYAAHVVWNNAAGELWRRTKQAIERHLGRRRGVPPIRVPCGDGKYRLVAPDELLPPPYVLTIADLDDAIRWAAQTISYSTPDHPARPGGWPVTWGTEIDIRAITLAGTSSITDLAVASYLAKYSTKGTEITGHASARLTLDNLDLYANPDGTHPERLIAACWKTGADPGYISLRRWAHMLGFGGHFLTKARRYSVRFADLRQARITYRRGQDPGPEHGPIRTADHTDDETVLIVGTFSFAGTGWKTSGDALLANSAGTGRQAA